MTLPQLASLSYSLDIRGAGCSIQGDDSAPLANTRRLSNAALVSGQCCVRWASSKPALGQSLLNSAHS